MLDTKETGKKFKPFAPVLSVALVTACVAGSLSGYEAPVYAATQEETPIKEEAKEKKEEKKTVAKGSFDLEDGVYKGTGTGYAGDITVSVQIKDKQIVSIDILSSSDDEAFFSRAKAVIDKIIEGQTLDVDTVSGATFSSRGIISAVKNALTGEKDNSTTGQAQSGQTAAAAGSSTSVAKVEDAAAYKDGTYYGSGTGFGGPLKVMVEISGGKIASIQIVENSDGSDYISKAASLIDSIIAKQSTNVDTVSGATYSSVLQTVLGAGLAGCEAALWLAGKGVQVDLYEQKPVHFSPAHKSAGFAELICSNSLKAERLDSASGLLKEEMRRMGSQLLTAAETARVAAGGALAVDRDAFSAEVTRMVESCENITVHREQVEHIDASAPILVATGPLTDGALADEIGALTGDERLHFYDAVAPIVTAESLDYNKVFAASRYDRGEADYLNCPFNKEEYEKFHAALASAERAPLHDFDTGAEQSAQPDPDAHGKKADTVTVYEGCMPIEIMAARGADTMRFGPLRPVGLVNPNTGHRPWANVQLRAENKERTLYNIVGFQTNLKWGEQKRVFSMIPGLENAEFVRYGVMHRNTFLDAPRVLSAQLCLKEHPNVFFAGQITGFEGYMESAACGLLAARSLYARLEGKELPAPPVDTMCGALVQYLTTENKHFQPMGANMGILPPLPEESRPRDKRLRYMAQAQRAVASFQHWLDETSL